jgi:Asp-tRNA(Asn)/Glu-tRNA(Gln) amidotransferase A subunit family amidase
MSDILSMTAVEARAALDKKAISAVELATTYIAAAEETGVAQQLCCRYGRPRAVDGGAV